MKSTVLILLGAALVAGGLTFSKRMSREDKQKLKEAMKRKLMESLPQGLQNKLSVSN